jgi:hypothetical protein
MSSTYNIQVATYLKGEQSSANASDKFLKKSLATVGIKLPQIMEWQQQNQYKGSVSSAVVHDAAVADIKTDGCSNKSPVCTRINSHSKACL